MTAKTAVSAAHARIAWIDAARGIGIILVVYGHALRGQMAAHLYPTSAASLWQDRLIYAFHMPLFFFLSGLFARIGTSRSGFVLKRLRSLAWPYLLWSLVQGLMSMAAGRYANAPIRFDELIRIGWQPIGQFWFLYALLLCDLLLLLPRILFFTLVPVLVIGSALSGRANIATLAAADLPYFALGVLIGARRLSEWLAGRGRAAGLMLCGWGMFASLLLWRDSIPTALFTYLIAIAGIAGTIGLAVLSARAGWLVALGAASMPIYLMHVIAQAGIRALVAPLSIPPAVMLGIVALFALIAPVVAWRLLSWLGLAEVLGLGKSVARVGADKPDSSRATLGIGKLRA